MNNIAVGPIGMHNELIDLQPDYLVLESIEAARRGMS